MRMFKDKIVNLSRKITNIIGSFASIIIHTFFFVGIFALRFFGISFSDILLILTTIVSLEAIYLSIFIQISINRNIKELEDVSESVDEIQEDVEDLQKDVEEISENID